MRAEPLLFFHFQRTPDSERQSHLPKDIQQQGGRDKTQGQPGDSAILLREAAGHAPALGKVPLGCMTPEVVLRASVAHLGIWFLEVSKES
jgi:hypothetical protein